MRIISLDGRLGGDAEVKKTKDGKEFIRFSLANNYFANGKEITDWFDVNCYDPFVVQNKIKLLTKGRYVIVTGNIRTEVSERNGKLWLNHYVTATNVDTPSFGRRSDDSSDSTASVSVYTGGTRSDMSQQQTVAQPAPAVAAAPVQQASAQAAINYPTYTPQVEEEYNGDDLPF